MQPPEIFWRNFWMKRLDSWSFYSMITWKLFPQYILGVEYDFNSWNKKFPARTQPDTPNLPLLANVILMYAKTVDMVSLNY